MDIQFYGANCVLLSDKNARIVIDDNLTDLDSKSIAKQGDIALFTGPHGTPVQPSKIIIDQPGEYEVSGVSINGIAARAHIDEEGQKNATMYKVTMEDLRVLVVGHVYPSLSDAQLEAIGMIDIMIVPVGGNGYTLDPLGALKVIKAVDPKMVIPTHYDSKGLHFPVPQQTLEEAVKVLGMEPKEQGAKLKVKSGDLTDTMQLAILEQS